MKSTSSSESIVPDKANSGTVTPLANGFSLRVDQEGTLLELCREAQCALRVELTENGPVLRFDAPQLKIVNSGGLELEADRIALRSRGDFVQETLGDFKQVTHGDHQVHVRDDMSMKAQAVSLEAELGEMSIRASDDVALNGLRVLHNIPSLEEIEEAYAKVKSFGEAMQCPAFDPRSPRRMRPSKPKPRQIG